MRPRAASRCLLPCCFAWGSLARGDCCSGARHDFGPRVRWHHRYSRTRPGENLRPVCFCPRERRWACVAAAPTERVGEKVFYGRHLFAAKPKVNSEHVYRDHEPCPELVSEVECSARLPTGHKCGLHRTSTHRHLRQALEQAFALKGHAGTAVPRLRR